MYTRLLPGSWYNSSENKSATWSTLAATWSVKEALYVLRSTSLYERGLKHAMASFDIPPRERIEAWRTLPRTIK